MKLESRCEMFTEKILSAIFVQNVSDNCSDPLQTGYYTYIVHGNRVYIEDLNKRKYEGRFKWKMGPEIYIQLDNEKIISIPSNEVYLIELQEEE